MPPESGSPKAEAPADATNKAADKAAEASTPVGKPAAKAAAKEDDGVPTSRGLGGQYKMVGGKRVRVTE